MAQRDRIKVVCRIRPENKLEKEGNYQKCVTYDDLNITVNCNPESKVSDMAGAHSFAFDKVFGPNVRQQDVFGEVAKPIVDGVLNGFNGTVFCYGQTGSGKTFTMEGADLYHEELKGLLPRMFTYLFQQIDKSDAAIEFNIKCSFVEIYMEKIQDLLDPKKNNLNVKEEKGKGIYVSDCTEVYVTSPEEMFEIMRAGSKNRSIAATRMNDKSSRSHSVFILTIHSKNTKTDASKLGKLYLCDLAGSEKVGKTNVSGQNLEEAKMINKSLSALGNVINALTEGKQGGHIPYRDSKLTRILQESLGGNSTTCLVITCSLSAYNDRETLSTLRFGNRAKNIKNKVVQNAERSAKELLIALHEAVGKIGKITELVKLIQGRLKQLIKDAPGDVQEAYKLLLEESKSISSASDLDYLFAKLKGHGSDILQQVIDEEEKAEAEEQEQEKDIEINVSSISLAPQPEAEEPQQQNTMQTFLTPVNTDKVEPVQQAANLANKKEQAVKLFKQHQEIVRLREELEKVEDEKKELENEVRARSEEIFQMNEKFMLQEINQSYTQIANGEQKQVMELQGRMDRMCDANLKRVGEMTKLKQCIERLKCDLHVLYLSKKLNKESSLNDESANNQEDGTQEASTDSDKMINDQIQSTLDIITKIETNLQSDIQQFSIDDPFSSDQKHERKKSMYDRQRMDTTIYSEMEYINILPDMEQMAMDDSSFLKGSFVNGGQDAKKNESNNQDSEKMEQQQEQNAEQLKRIGELEKLIETQSQQITQLTQQTTQEEDQTQEQKPIEEDQTNDLDTLKKDNDFKQKQLTELQEIFQKEQDHKERIILDLQSKLREEKDQVERMLENNVDKRHLFELEHKCKLLQEKNKFLQTEMFNYRKEQDHKEFELEKAQTKASQLEKKLVLMQRSVDQAKLQQKQSPMISQYMMPFQNNGQVQFGTIENYMMGQQPITAQVQQPIQTQQNDVPLFFSRKVVKPVKGGGKGVPASNPYSQNQVKAAPAMNFSEFQQKLAQPQGQRRSGQAPPILGNLNAPIIKPEFQKEFLNTINQQTPQQIQQLHQKNREALQKAKKEIYKQKFKEAKQLTMQQQNLEESFQSGDSDDDEDEDEEEEEETNSPKLDMKKAADIHRRGKSVHASSSQHINRSKTESINKQKKGLKMTIKNAFRNFF